VSTAIFYCFPPSLVPPPLRCILRADNRQWLLDGRIDTTTIGSRSAMISVGRRAGASVRLGRPPEPFGKFAGLGQVSDRRGSIVFCHPRRGHPRADSRQDGGPRLGDNSTQAHDFR
jgi:hypothetical protein